MKGVFCPVAGAVTWANDTIKGDPRCTKCGNPHTAAKGASIAMFEETKSKTKGKKFKKGKKTR